jgi:YHS domain-containing protein
MSSDVKKLSVAVVSGILVLAVSLVFMTPAVKAEQSPAVKAAVEQTTCPVMGGTINKEIFTEYKGKKVYFCCPMCKPKFEKDPEKYISKLPQFAK